VSIETAAVLNDLKQAPIAEYESRLATRPPTRRKSDREAQQTRALLKNTLDSLKDTVERIGKSQEVVATSWAFLEEMKENERALGIKRGTPLIFRSKRSPNRRHLKAETTLCLHSSEWRHLAVAVPS
jgi:hypothetical protein